MSSFRTLMSSHCRELIRATIFSVDIAVFVVIKVVKLVVTALYGVQKGHRVP